MHEPEPGATDDELEQAQCLTGRRLPDAAVELYRAVAARGRGARSLVVEI